MLWNSYRGLYVTTYNFCFYSQNNDEPPKPTPRLKLNENSYNLPELPSVPSNPAPPSPNASDDIDFDDLTKRFNELKKKHWEIWAACFLLYETNI